MRSSNAPIGADCITDLGTLGAGAVSRSGTLAAGCTSLRRGDAQSPHYARRFSLRVPAASVATFTASSSAADVFLYVLSGSGSTVTEVASDDDSGTGTDAQAAGVALAAGTTYTIEVTTSAANATGAFSLSGTIALKEPPVVITGLADGTGWGLAAATVTASDGFTVEPADASCTATTATAGVTPSVSSGTVAGERTVSLALAAPFSHEATVSCDATGRTATEATATLAGKVAVSTVTVAAGDSCTGTSAAGYACTVPGDGTLSVTATAQGAHGGLSIAWTATGGVSVAAPTQTAVVPTPGVGFSRTSTAALACTADGTVTVTVSAGGVRETAAVSVTCDIAVACDDPLGELAAGDIARSGTISADADCVSEVRGAEQAWRMHYVRRHTFTLAGDATVTVDLGTAAHSTPKLDTWLILFKGRTAEGTPVAQDGFSGPGTDSRIARKLAAGDYTIEATTFFSRAGGDYDLNVNIRYDKQTAITGLVGAAKTGSGQVGFARPFTVAPAAAECTPDPDTATVATGTGPADRTLTASIGSPGSLQVTVTCETAGYVAASQTVTLTAQLACSTHLGTLTPGITTHSGGLWGGNPCRSPQRFTDGGNSITRYAHRHTFTLVNPGTITIDLASAPANRPPLDTYLILLKGHSGDGTGTVAGRDDDSGTGTNSRLSSIKLAPGDYSVEATTDKYRRTGDYDLTIDAAPGAGAACTGDLGILAAGRYTRTGTVAAVEGCASAQRGTPTSRPWARWHTFTLAEPAWVDIDLAAATASSLDPYLLLLSGDDNTGTILAQDDSSGTGTAAQIRGRHLQAGTYIIEATAAASTGTTSTGAYTLTVTVPIHGLPQTIHATVDQQTTTNFTYWPADARTRIARDSVSARESLRMLYSSAAGTGTLSLEVPIVDTHQLGLNYSSEVGMSSGQTRSAIRSGQSDTTDRQFGVEVRGGCDPGEIVSPYNGLRCVPFEGAADDVVLPSTRGSKFQVTRGTLIGVDQAAREALAAYNVSSQGPCQAAAVTDTYLAAVLLSIPFKEVRTGYRTSPARSPMSLPRTDYAKNAKSPLVKLYSFDDFTKDPKRAFWHPSAGLWKIDDTYGYKGTFELNHADRAHVITAAKHATKHILPALCSDSVVSDSDKDKAFSKWLGCHFPSLGVNHECRLEVLPKLYVEATSSRPEGLWVTTEHNKNDYSLTGGVSSHRCRWGVSGASFSCWFYDAAKRQGYVDIFDPEADDPVNFDGTVYKPVRSPLAAPFLSFNHGERLGEQRFVVFPHSLLSGDDPVVSDTLIKAVPTDDETGSARAWYPVSDDPLVDADDPDGDEDDDHSWEVNTYGQQVLWVQVCPPGIWELGGNLCQWVSTNAGDSDPLGSFATRIRALGY